MKACSVCGEVKPLQDYHRNGRRKDGRSNKCKPCACAVTRAWTAANPERHKATKSGNPATQRATARRWRELNPEKARESRREARAKFKSQRPEEYRVRKRLETSGRRLTGDATKYGVVLGHDPCSYCGAAHAGTLDHIVPLKSNGTNEWENLTAACLSCNSSKSSRNLLTYLMEKN